VLPAEGVLRAAQRWLDLLERSDVVQAAALIRSEARLTDLSTTQYASALDWLRAVGFVVDGSFGSALHPELRGLSGSAKGQHLFRSSLQALDPPWLLDAEILIQDEADLPQDALRLAELFGLNDSAAVVGIRQVHGRVDLEARARVGAAGEAALVALLEARWPGSTIHASLRDDSLGYDAAFTLADRTWHLEIKSTTRRGQLVIYLSRRELEVAARDRDWCLVVVGLDDFLAATAVVAVDRERLLHRVPVDAHVSVRWESARYQLNAADLSARLPFLNDQSARAALQMSGEAPTFAWAPEHL
jgi:hypothetical protein